MQAHGVHVRAGPQPITPDDRFPRVGSGADHVRRPDRVLDASGAPPDLLRELRRLRSVSARDQDGAKLPGPRDVARVRRRLDAGADDGEHSSVLAREQAGGQRRPGRGPLGGDLLPVEQRQRRPAARIEHRDQRLVRRGPDVLRKHRHQLRRKNVERARSPPSRPAGRPG